MTEQTTTPVAAAPRAHAAAGVLKRFSAYNVDPRTVTRREGWNPRFDFGEIAELAKSIKVNGILNPIRVKRIAPRTEGDRTLNFELVDGERRFTAVELILEDTPDFFPDGIPAIVIDKSQDDLTSLIQMFEANSGKAFLPLEEAAAYKRMRDAGLSIKAICEHVGRAVPHVTEMLALLEADDSVKEAVKDGSIGKQMGKIIASRAKGDKEAQKKLVAAAKAAAGTKGGKAAVRQAAEDAKRAKAGKTLKIKPLDEAALSKLGAQQAADVKLKLKHAGKADSFDIMAWVKGDDKLALAFAFGTLEALKAAAGQKINLSI